MAYPPQMRVLSALNGRLMTTKIDQSDESLSRKLREIFCSRNSIHGINNFLRESIAVYERFIWLLVLVFTIIGMIYVSLILSKTYRDGRFETVVDNTYYPIYKIPFPTVTICNHNRLNWKRLEAAKMKFMPLDRDPLKLELFARFISAFDGLTFGKFDAFANVSGAPLKLLDGLNITEVFTFMTWTCEEMFSDCKWRNKNHNCCELFHRQHSELGPCFTFNGIQNKPTSNGVSMNPSYPLHNSDYGPTSGLKVRVLIYPENHLPASVQSKGIEVMIHEAKVWQSDNFFISGNTATSVGLNPLIYLHDNDTRRIPSSLRKCVFGDEKDSKDFKTLPGFEFMLENCLSQCHQEHLIRYCNCTSDLFFPPDNYPLCRASDFQCIYDNRDTFRYTKEYGEEKYVFNKHEGMTCQCFHNCHSLSYFPEVRPSYLPTDMLGNLSFVNVDVHYRYDSIMVYKTNLVFGWLDLLVSFGGIAGLFLGCSLISAVEILYFVGVDIPQVVYHHIKNNWREKIPKSEGLQRWADSIGNRNKDQLLHNHRPNVFRVETVLHRSRY